jgi:hypothetical protein
VNEGKDSVLQQKPRAITESELSFIIDAEAFAEVLAINDIGSVVIFIDGASSSFLHEGYTSEIIKMQKYVIL